MRIGVDLGGTKIEAVALGTDGEALARRRVATPRGDYAATISAITAIVRGLESEAGERGSVGIGIPGAESPATGLIKNANSVWLIGKPFAKDLAEALGRPVRLANDADCFALSEATDGAGEGAKSVFGAILGTGVGGGIVIDGRLLSGVNAIAGEWGHNPLPWPVGDETPGPQCYCGRLGCIETFLSGPGLVRDHAACGGAEGVDAATLAERAAAGDADADATLARWEHRLARALATVVNLIDPEVIVLGGGLSHLDRAYETVPALWGGFVFSDRVETRLARARHGAAGGVRGAAWLWPEGPARPAPR